MLGPSFAIDTGSVLTFYIGTPLDGRSVRVRVVDEISGAVFEQEIIADIASSSQFLCLRLYISTGAKAAAVVCDCAGVYLEPDFCSP